MFEVMAQRTSENLIASSASGRAEITAAIEGLADEVAHLARKISCIVSTANAKGNSPREKAECEGALCSTPIGTNCEALVCETAEAKNVPLSPQQNTEIDEDIPRELVEETNVNFKTSLPEPAHTADREENAIATRVADLYDRLGGFIKTALPKAPNDNR